MPFLRIEMLEGRSEKKKQSLAREVSKAVSRALKIDQEEVNIVIKDVGSENWTKGGTLLTDREKSQ
ncbi:tautomerase family protein [Lentibacillus sp. L22]|uniref:tautomerase family protein n=1 Tax=Lentibacillus TaxID=175304 RepID=UPI0022B1464B|nr:tautomerase family protein [Lentibacillus daqui]